MEAGDGCARLRDQRIRWSGTYPAVPESVAAMRAALARFAGSAGVPSRIEEKVVLAASEAVTNVVMHAYRDHAQPGHVDVDVVIAGDELAVTVRDGGLGLRARSDSPGLGLGLAIVARVADRFDVLASPAGGVEVRMYFAIPAGAG